MLKRIDPLMFVVIGNFITSCYTRNWAWLDLLRKPIVFNGSVNRTIITFNMPSWIPAGDSVLILNDGRMQAKMKDFPFKRREQITDQKTRLMVVKVELPGEESVKSAKLTYSPWFRFVTEPVDFLISDQVATYVTKAVDYALRREGEVTELQQVENGMSLSFDHGKRRFEAIGESELEKIQLHEDTAELSALDFKARILSLSDRLSPSLTQTLYAMSDSTELANCSRTKINDLTVLRYVF